MNLRIVVFSILIGVFGVKWFIKMNELNPPPLILPNCGIVRDTMEYVFLVNPETGHCIIQTKIFDYTRTYFGFYAITSKDTSGQASRERAFRFQDTCHAKTVYDDWRTRKAYEQIQAKQKSRVRDSVDSVRNIFIAIEN